MIGCGVQILMVISYLDNEMEFLETATDTNRGSAQRTLGCEAREDQGYAEH